MVTSLEHVSIGRTAKLDAWRPLHKGEHGVRPYAIVTNVWPGRLTGEEGVASVCCLLWVFWVEVIDQLGVD